MPYKAYNGEKQHKDFWPACQVAKHSIFENGVSKTHGLLTLQRELTKEDIIDFVDCLHSVCISSQKQKIKTW